jgi:hypothetical protein
MTVESGAGTAPLNFFFFLHHSVIKRRTERGKIGAKEPKLSKNRYTHCYCYCMY